MHTVGGVEMSVGQRSSWRHGRRCLYRGAGPVSQRDLVDRQLVNI